MGYYFDASGEQRAPRRFVIRELIRAMGYSESMVMHPERVAWWPGIARLRKLVAWRVTIRRMQGGVDLESGGDPAAPLMAAAIEEIDRRLAEQPELISSRDLSRFGTQLARILEVARTNKRETRRPPEAGKPALAGIIETIEALPEGPMRERAYRDLEAAKQRVLAAMPTAVGREGGTARSRQVGET